MRNNKSTWLIALCMFVVFRSNAAFSVETLKEKHFSLQPNSNMEIIGVEDGFWMLNEDLLQRYSFDRIDESVELERMYRSDEKVIAFEKDRMNIYRISESRIDIFPIKTPNQVMTYSAGDIGLGSGIRSYSLGSRLIVASDKELAIYDSVSRSWKKLAPGFDEEIKTVIEKYGFIITVSGGKIAIHDVDGKTLSDLVDIPDLRQDFELVDFMMTRDGKTIWLAANKMIQKITLGNEDNPSETKLYKPYEEPTVSNIRKFFFSHGNIIVVYNDALFQFNPEKETWTCIVAGGIRKNENDNQDDSEIVPLLDLGEGLFTAFHKSGDSMLIGTTNHGILKVDLSGKTENPSVERFNSENGLPSAYIDDLTVMDSGTILAKTGDGVFACSQDAGDSTMSCVSALDPTYLKLASDSHTRFVEKYIALDGKKYFLQQNQLYVYENSGEVQPVTLMVHENEEDVRQVESDFVDVAVFKGKLLVAGPENLWLADSDGTVVKEVSLSDIETGKTFDSDISSLNTYKNNLVIGMKKRFEVKIEFDDEKQEAGKSAESDEEDTKFMTQMASLYIVDSGFQTKEKYGKQEGLFVKQISEILAVEGNLFVFGSDVRKGSNMLYKLKAGKWNSLGDEQVYKQYNPENVIFSSSRFQFFKGNEYFALDTDGKLVCTGALALNEYGEEEYFLSELEGGEWVGREVPKTVKSIKGIIDSEGYRVLIGSGIYFKAPDENWVSLSRQFVYSTYRDSSDSYILSLSRGPGVFLADEFIRRIEKNNSEQKDKEFSADVFLSTRRPRAEQKIEKLSEVVEPEDIAFDIGFSLRGPPSLESAKNISESFGWSLVRSDADSNWFEVKIGANEDLNGALKRIRKDENVNIAVSNIYHDTTGTTAFVADEIILSFTPEATSENITDVLEKYNLESLRRIGNSVIAVNKSGKRLPAVVGELQGESSVKYASLNLMAGAQEDDAPVQLPDDPEFENQWALKKIGFDKMWNRELLVNPTAVIVAVLDTGVDDAHPDLQGRVIQGPNFVDGTLESKDDNGHGTHVAGIVAADTNNGTGIAGLCDTCQVLSVKVLDADGFGTYADVAEAIYYVVDDGRARVINISLSGYGYSEILKEAVEYAAANGVLIVSSVANDANEAPTFPAAFPTVLAVSATDSEDAISLDANFGDYIDIVAPGMGVLSTYLDGGYKELSGTSVSAALVSGLAARFISHYQDVSPEEVKGMLYQTADDIGDAGVDAVYGNGRINADSMFTDQNLLASAAAYYEQYDQSGSGDLTEAPADLDIVAADGFFKKLCRAFKKFLGGIFTFISEVAKAIAREVAEGLKQLIEEVGRFFDMLYKRILRPILFFYCKALCPAIMTVGKAEKAGILKIAEASPVGAYLSVAAAVCSYGCPALEAVGVIVPPTRMMCVESDPVYSGPDKVEIDMKDLIEDETDGGPYEIHYPDGKIVMVESAVDAIQETFFYGQENPEVEFDGIIFEKQDYDASLLVSEQKCFRVEYNPYSKITKVFNSVNQIIDVYSTAQTVVTEWETMKDEFGKAMDHSQGIDYQYQHGHAFINSLKNIATHIPGEDGAQIRENINQFDKYFTYLDEYIVHGDDRINNILESIEEVEETISQWNPDSVDYDFTLGALGDISGLLDQFSGVFSDIDMNLLDIGVQDLFSNLGNLKDLLNSDYDIEDLLNDILNIRANWNGIKFACKFKADEPLCIKIRDLDLGDIINDIGKFKIPELPNLDDCFNWPSGKGFCELFGMDGDSGLEVDTSSNPITTQNVEMRVRDQNTGDVVYTESYVPEINQDDPLLPARKTMRWDYRDDDGKRVSTGDYLVSLVYTHFDGRKKEVSVVGQNDVDYPPAYPELEDEELSGAISQAAFHVDEGQEFFIFEYDFGNKNGADNVIEVKLEIYDSGNKLVFEEARQVPYLADDPNIYDRRFVWNLKDISTGLPVPDDSYTFRLITTMLSSKVYTSYFTHDVNRDDAIPDDQEETPEEPVAEEPEDAEFIVPPFIGPYEKYMTFQKDDDGEIIGATDSFGNKYTFNRDDAGEITSVVYPDGSTAVYAPGTSNVSTFTDPNGNTLTYEYDSEGRVKSVTDPFGKAMTYAYSAGQVTLTDPSGRSATMTLNEKGVASSLQLPGQPLQVFHYDSNGNLSSVKIGDNDPATYIYDAANRMTSMTDPLGNTTEYVYDPSTGYLATVKEPKGDEISYTYDARGNVLTRTDAEGNETSYTYDSKNRPLSKTKADGSTVTYTYDDKGRLETMTQAGGITRFTYDDANRLTQMDVMGRTTQIEYDDAGNITKITDPENHSVSSVYNDNGLLTSFTDARNNTTTYEYDGQGRITAIHQPLGRNMTIAYGQDGKVSSITDARSNTTTYTYDDLGRLASETNPLGGVKSYTYDVDGRIASETDELDRTTSYEYDAAGNLITVTHPGDITESYEYDDNGNMTAYTDRNGERTEYGYDDANNMTSVITPGGSETIYQYEGGNMTGVTTAGKTTSYSYNDLGQVETVTDAIGQVSYGYDPLGNLKSFTGIDGETSSYSYYNDNAPQSSSDPAGETISYKEYDENGNVARITDGLGNTVQFQYDELNRLIQLTSPNGGIWVYGYDLNGNLTSVTDALGQTTTYEYDALNRKTGETRADGVSISYGYDAAGNMASVQGPHQDITKTYDNFNRVTSVTATPKSEYAPPQYTLSYTYDNLGNLTSMTGPAGTTTYAYDDDSNLITTTLPNQEIVEYEYTDDGKPSNIVYPNGVVLSIDYDEEGNMSVYTATSNGQPVANYNSLNDMISNNWNDIEKSKRYDNMQMLQEDEEYYYRYDLNGNLIERSQKSSGTKEVYEYDATNKLVRVKSGDSISRYFYNALGIRISKTINDELHKYVMDENRQLMGEYSSTGVLLASYLYGNSDRDVIAMIRDSDNNGLLETFYYILSKTGNVSAITNVNGETVNEYRYEGMGELSRIDCYDPVSEIANSYIQEYFDDAFTFEDSLCVPNYLTYLGGEYDPETEFTNAVKGYIYGNIGSYIQSDFVTWAVEHESDIMSMVNGDLNVREFVTNDFVETLSDRFPGIEWSDVLQQNGTTINLPTANGLLNNLLGSMNYDSALVEKLSDVYHGIERNLKELNICRDKRPDPSEDEGKEDLRIVNYRVSPSSIESNDSIQVRAELSENVPAEWSLIISSDKREKTYNGIAPKGRSIEFAWKPYEDENFSHEEDELMIQVSAKTVKEKLYSPKWKISSVQKGYRVAVRFPDYNYKQWIPSPNVTMKFVAALIDKDKQPVTGHSYKVEFHFKENVAFEWAESEYDAGNVHKDGIGNDFVSKNMNSNNGMAEVEITSRHVISLADVEARIYIGREYISETLEMPFDGDGDQIADAWEKQYTDRLSAMGRNYDGEEAISANDDIGDNLLLEDEYFGVFYIDSSGDGVYKRLDPTREEVLIDLDEQDWGSQFNHPSYLETTKSVFGAQDIDFYFIEKRQHIYKTKIHLEYREMGANMDSCIDYDSGETFARAYPSTNQIDIYMDMIFKSVACKNSSYTPDEVMAEVDRSINRVLAHEIGHLLGINGDYSCNYSDSNLMCYGCDPKISGSYCYEYEKDGQTYHYDTRFASFLYSRRNYTITNNQKEALKIW